MRAVRAANILVVGVMLIVLATSPWTGVDLVDLAYHSLTVATALSVAFTVTYVARSRWSARAAGRSLVYVLLMLSGTLTLIAIFYYSGGDYWGRPQLIFVGFTGMALVLGNLLVTLLGYQRRDRKGSE